jgi:hypothetical protein
VRAAGGEPARLSAAKSANPGTVGKPRRLFGDRLYPLSDAARNADPAVMRQLLRDALDTDAKGKSGGGTPAIDLEAMAVRFSEALGGPHRR